MSIHTFPDKLVTTRKPHDCAWCGEIVEKGASAYAGATLDDGKFCSTWMHSECQNALLGSWLYCPFELGTMKRGIPVDQISPIV